VGERLVIQNLSKKYDAFTALAPTDLTLDAGEIVILSGMNGSGKTTLLSCIAGLVKPSTGTISLDSFDLYDDEVEVRRRMAFVPDVPRFYVELTAWEHLRFIAMANNALVGFEDRAKEILEKFGLWDVRNQFPHHFSRGMQLKLGLALAFIRPFEVLMLDEPTSALDEESVNTLRHQLESLKAQGAGILMSSHDPMIKQQFGDRQIHMAGGILSEI
jgi:ABC-2 type transport system ATP-binding protein